MILKQINDNEKSLESDTKKLKEIIDFIRSRDLNKNFSFDKLYGALLSVYNESLA